MIGFWISILNCRDHWPNHFYQMDKEAMIQMTQYHTELYSCNQQCIQGTAWIWSTPSVIRQIWIHGASFIWIPHHELKITGPDFAHWGEGLAKYIDKSRPRQNGDVGELFGVEASQSASPFPAMMMPPLSLVNHAYTSIFLLLSNLGLLKYFDKITCSNRQLTDKISFFFFFLLYSGTFAF